MLKKHAAATSDAPKAIGPYSQALSAGNLVFVSGQLGLDPETGEFAGGDAAAQTEQAMKNIQAILGSMWLGMEHILKTTIYVTDLDAFAEINEVYARFFQEPYPARACVEVSRLPKGALVEIEAIAAGKE